MSSNHVSLFKRKMLLFGAIAIALFFISSATIVPQVEGATVNDQIDTVNNQNNLLNMLQNIQNVDTISEQQRLQVTYLLVTLLKEIVIPSDSTKQSMNLDTLAETATQIKQSRITPQGIKNVASETIIQLDKTLTEKITDENTPQSQGFLFNIFKNILNKLLSNIINIDTLTGEGLIDILMNLFSMMSSLPSLLFKIIGQGATLIIQSIIRIIRALISMIVLFVSGVQLALLLTGLFFIFLGYASKVGIKALSIISAPLFALMAIMFSLATGSFVGGVSLILNFAAGFIITFAIPISIILLIIWLISDGDFNFDFFNFDLDFLDNDGGFFYMIGSIITSILNPSAA